MKKVAIVGTGIMGHGMALNFLKHGYEVFVWNRTKEKLADLEKAGAKVVETPHDAAEKSDILFEVTSNDESSKDVWLGDEGILSSARANSILIASSTLSIPWVDELIGLIKEKGASFLDVPLTGSRAGAEGGTMVLFVGGDEKVLKEIELELSAISSKYFYFGKAGTGMRYKLLFNMLQGIHGAGLQEVLKIAEKEGMNIKAVGDALCERPGGTTTAVMWKDSQNSPDKVNFSTKLMAKDMAYAKEFAGGIQTPLLNDILKKYSDAVQNGQGEENWTTVND